MDDGGSVIFVFLFSDPHSLKGGEWGEDTSSDPDRVFSFWGSQDFDFHGRWG